LNVERGTLFIRDGFSHYPQTRLDIRIFPGDPNRPTRILIVDGSGSVSFDVIDWLREQDIPLVRVDWRGAATVIAGRDSYAAAYSAWRRQEALRSDPERRLAIARRLIEQKLRASLETLETQLPPTPKRTFATEVILEKLAHLRSRQPLDVPGLHGIEGRAAKVYFDAWTGTPLRWRVSKRYPIPDNWRVIGQRQSLTTGKKGKNRDASHPVNAMLNYAYAVLESEVRLQVLANGLDPKSGFLHSGFRDSHALVLDLMEPLRPTVDATVLRLALAGMFNGADFVLRPDGVCRLNPNLAREVARLSANSISGRGAALSLIPT
jgi:CRISP-associated protein Cas1